MSDAKKAPLGWHRRDDGAICYGAECFDLVIKPDGRPELHFDDECQVEEASAADRKVMESIISGEGITYRRRHHGR